MRKFVAAAASLAAAGMIASAPASADIELGICFDIVDQLYIEHGVDACTAVADVTLYESGQTGYTIKLDAEGNLLCTALEGKYLAEYGPIYGKMMFDPICTDGSKGCGQSFKLVKIGPDAEKCGSGG